ncbi:MAG TPA: DUF5947 family protein [Solirubrobacteraceae bacterium]|nr:DUF5947 family protein [Solirubrobacteraceae bacterium]
MSTIASSRLRALAQRSAEARESVQERCELCGEPIAAEHRHLLDLSTREAMCACRACALLFDRSAAGGGRYRLVPDRRLALADLELDDVSWEELRIPVDMAFFSFDSRAQRVVALYPGPMGATESLLELDAWDAIEAANPVLRSLQPDVEALLVNRARGARQQWVVPIADCYSLVGLIRTRWRGLTGGREVWEEIGRFFEELDRRSRPASAHDDQEATWPG